ncbi:MAG: motility associated factor glycosyltransferase family protein [Acidiferrobacterales bacterium]
MATQAAIRKQAASETKAARGEKAPDKDNLFERNLAAFERKFGSVHKLLASFERTHSTLVHDEDGDVDIEFRGERCYGAGARRFAERQIDDVLKTPLRVRMSPPMTGTLDDIATSFTHKILRRAGDEGIEFAVDQVKPECFCLLVFGVGLGVHIEPLVERTRCRVLFLVEPNLEFLYHSLFVTDWEALIGRFKEEDMHLILEVDKNYNKVAFDIRAQIRALVPTLFDGTIIYTHYHNPTMERTKEEISKDLRMAFAGLGFVEDEITMIRNSYHNLKDYESYYFKHTDMTRRAPAFVVGAGPSLDENIDTIRENQDKALIVSCGTALGALLANGITPDFQIEMENVDAVYELLSETAKTHDLGKICLVATPTICPGTRDLFEKTLFFFRPGLCTWEMFSLGDDTGLSDVGPTVSNCGLSFAQELGSREIYFFGMDFGTKNPEVHHAKDSTYMQDKGLEYDGVLDEPYPGNFGGTVYTDHTMKWARGVVEDSVRRNSQGRTYYNCSDGVRMEGAIPKVAKSVSLNGTVDKAKEIDDILNKFPRYTRADFDRAWTDEDYSAAVEKLCTELIELCGLRDEDFSLRYFLKLSKALIDHEKAGAEIPMLRGSVFMQLMSGWFYVARVTDPEKVPVMEDIVRTEIVSSIKEMEKRVVDFLREL